MNPIVYECEETGIIIEKEMLNFSLFCTAMKYDIIYKKEQSRFLFNTRGIYGLPTQNAPKKHYYGVDREGLTEYDKYKCILSKEQNRILQKCKSDTFYGNTLMKNEEDAIKFLRIFQAKDDYELIWTQSVDEKSIVPDNYRFIGFDISYPPEYWGAFSIICDCMFICRWHGCDEEGILFVSDFAKLNENGLFNRFDDAYNYMVKYLSQDWSERGEYVILEVYKKHNK